MDSSDKVTGYNRKTAGMYLTNYQRGRGKNQYYGYNNNRVRHRGTWGRGGRRGVGITRRHNQSERPDDEASTSSPIEGSRTIPVVTPRIAKCSRGRGRVTFRRATFSSSRGYIPRDHRPPRPVSGLDYYKAAQAAQAVKDQESSAEKQVLSKLVDMLSDEVSKLRVAHRKDSAEIEHWKTSWGEAQDEIEQLKDEIRNLQNFKINHNHDCKLSALTPELNTLFIDFRANHQKLAVLKEQNDANSTMYENAKQSLQTHMKYCAESMSHVEQEIAVLIERADYLDTKHPAEVIPNLEAKITQLEMELLEEKTKTSTATEKYINVAKSYQEDKQQWEDADARYEAEIKTLKADNHVQKYNHEKEKERLQAALSKFDLQRHKVPKQGGYQAKKGTPKGVNVVATADQWKQMKRAMELELKTARDELQTTRELLKRPPQPPVVTPLKKVNASTQIETFDDDARLKKALKTSQDTNVMLQAHCEQSNREVLMRISENETLTATVAQLTEEVSQARDLINKLQNSATDAAPREETPAQQMNPQPIIDDSRSKSQLKIENQRLRRSYQTQTSTIAHLTQELNASKKEKVDESVKLKSAEEIVAALTEEKNRLRKELKESEDTITRLKKTLKTRDLSLFKQRQICEEKRAKLKEVSDQRDVLLSLK